MRSDRDFATRFKLARTAKAYTYSEVARRLTQAGEPISPQAVRQWEHPTEEKVVTPRLSKMRALARALMVDYEWLAYGIGDMRPPERGTAAPTLAAVPTPSRTDPHWQERHAYAHAWEAALGGALPEGYKGYLGGPPIQIGNWRRSFDYASPRLLVEILTYRDPRLLISFGPRRLWDLLIASRLLSRQAMLLLVPIAGDADLDHRALTSLAWQAQTVGLRVQIARQPADAVALILQIEQAPDTPSTEPDWVFDDELDALDDTISGV